MTSRPGPGRLAGLVVLALAVFPHCHDSERRDSPSAPAPSAAAEGSSPAEAPTPAGTLPEATLDAAAALLCRAYDEWPRLVLDDAFAAALDTDLVALTRPLSPEARAQLEAAPLAERAQAACPDVLVAERIAPAGLPRPAGRLQGMPGLYAAEAPNGESEARVTLEWTAIGLGCTGLTGASEAWLADAQENLLNGMGFTLESYVEASLANADVALSDRIFRGIHACAERAGAHVVE